MFSHGISSNMSASKLTSLPSLRRQNLLAEFAGLKQACPEGVFVTLTPGDPSLWSGAIFVRKGPYASTVLRFQISFPDTYPGLPPLVTFSTDIFHPLITPLTTYTYSTDVEDDGTVSATDEERLPPGGFSLRHGFPDWFGRATRKRASGMQQIPPGMSVLAQTPPRQTIAGSEGTPDSNSVSPRGGSGSSGLPPYMQTKAASQVHIYDVLRYIRSTFDDDTVLDAVPLQAAGNPGAWHAWRAHRRQQGVDLPELTKTSAATGTATDAGARKPGQWNWEHVWEERVKKGIQASLSDPVLFGSAGAADDVIRFLSMEDADVEAVKDNLKRTLGTTA